MSIAPNTRDFTVLVVGIPFYLGCKYIPDENVVHNLSVRTAEAKTTNTVTKHGRARTIYRGGIYEMK